MADPTDRIFSGLAKPTFEQLHYVEHASLVPVPPGDLYAHWESGAAPV